MFSDIKYYIQMILCYNGIHWYKEKTCQDKLFGRCTNPRTTNIRYVCSWCGKVKKVEVW